MAEEGDKETTINRSNVWEDQEVSPELNRKSLNDLNEQLYSVLMAWQSSEEEVQLDRVSLEDIKSKPALAQQLKEGLRVSKKAIAKAIINGVKEGEIAIVVVLNKTAKAPEAALIEKKNGETAGYLPFLFFPANFGQINPEKQKQLVEQSLLELFLLDVKTTAKRKKRGKLDNPTEDITSLATFFNPEKLSK